MGTYAYAMDAVPVQPVTETTPMWGCAWALLNQASARRAAAALRRQAAVPGAIDGPASRQLLSLANAIEARTA
ncbi:MAG: hypothetical protein M3Y32_04185 [Pseudomonadota bacterium]|nr:hypothetical protein [Pseudomonadota bacterium]